MDSWPESVSTVAAMATLVISVRDAMKDKILAAISVVVIAFAFVTAARIVLDAAPDSVETADISRTDTPSVAVASRPSVAVAHVASTPFVEAEPVVHTDEAERVFRLALLSDLNDAARVARDRKIARGETEPWNDGVPPKARPFDRVYTRAGKTASGVTFAYHVVVRPEDDAEYARAVWRWQDYLLEHPK